MNSPEPDPIERALARVYRATTSTIVTPEVDVIIGRARHHRATRVVTVGAAAAIAIVLALTLTVANPWRSAEGPVPPAGSSIPSGTRTSAAPTPTVPTVDGRTDPWQAMPAGFLETLLLRTDPNQLFEGETRGSVNTCGTDSNGGVTTTRLVGSAGFARAVLTLLFYGDQANAHSAFGVMARSLNDCVGFPDVTATPMQISSGDESAAVSFPKPADGAGEMTNWPWRVVAVRVGRAILLVDAGPYGGPNRPQQAPSAQSLRELTQALVPRLCVYADAGCPRPQDLPAPLDHLTQDGQAWLLVLYVFQGDDGAALPGTAVGAAAELGYHPTIVRQGCDGGANLAGLSDPAQTRYVAAYFASLQDAQAAADALGAQQVAAMSPYLQVLHVQTRCVG